MKCSFCGAKIGVLRSLVDQQYCSSDHKKKAKAKSARQARENSWIYGDEDLYPVYEVLTQTRRAKPSEKLQKTQAAAAMAIAVVLIFVLTFSWLSGQGGTGAPPTPAAAAPSLVGDLKKPGAGAPSGFGRWLDGLSNSLPAAKAPVNIRDDFKSGLDNWVGAPLSATVARSSESGWSWNNGIARPGRLRIWKPSAELADYKLEFEGVIEKRAVSWTYRSADLANYYATKLVLKRPTPTPTYEIVRFAVVAGRQINAVRLPLPPTLTGHAVQHIETRVKGSQYTTFLNGQVIDNWSDSRIKKGGVGFFSEPGEQAAIHWVNVTEESDGILGKLLSLAFFVNPALTAVPLH